MKLGYALAVHLLVAELASVAAMMTNTTGTTPNSSAMEPPACANRCMVDSMYVTQCLDLRCLCRGKEYQQSLLQCLYSQCDSTEYGHALGYTINICVGTGAEIHMAAPNHFSVDLLRSREDAYLKGREVLDVPGLKLRQESVDVNAQIATVTLTVISPGAGSFITVTQTATATTTIAVPNAQPTQFESSKMMVSDNNTGSSFRPWLVTTAEARRMHPSYISLVVWFAFVVAQDIWYYG